MPNIFRTSGLKYQPEDILIEKVLKILKSIKSFVSPQFLLTCASRRNN